LESLFNRTGFLVLMRIGAVTAFVSPPCHCEEERRGNLIPTINANALAISSRVSDGSENPLRSKECSVQPDPKGHAQKEIEL
jgi:hypothetical protein